MISITATDKSGPTYGLITNFVLKTTNQSHLYIQNMNKKFIMDNITVHISSPCLLVACLGVRNIFLRLQPLRRCRCHGDRGNYEIW